MSDFSSNWFYFCLYYSVLATGILFYNCYNFISIVLATLIQSKE